MGDFKNTLLLPQTDMPINADLPNREPAVYRLWDESQIINRMYRDGQNPFILHDGPPYANGDIHIGHALNKILKDFTVKYHFFNGRSVEFVPGWDCHGLPIEQKVLANRVDASELHPGVFRQLCRRYASSQINAQMSQFKALGVLADWDRRYETMSKPFETMVYQSLCELLTKGLVAQRKKPVYWSWSEQTALAEAEVEYKDQVDDSIYVLFPTSEETFPGGFLVWTTTPWTLPANVAVALNPEAQYIAVRIKDRISPFIVAKDLYENLLSKGLVGETLHYLFTGKDFEGWKLKHPIYSDQEVPVVMADFVTNETGTGCVHIAPGHGDNDYQLGLKNNLPIVMPVGPNGVYSEGKYAGQFIFKANQTIMDDLAADDRLIGAEKITHSCPHSSRSGKPVIFRATNQFFVDLDKLRSNTLKAIESVEFFPEHHKNRMEPMLLNRPDWCISRQRRWGVPIAFIRNKHTGRIVSDPYVLNCIMEREAEEGSDAWSLIGRGPSCYDSTLDEENFESVQDVLDVWFDSGLTWTILNGRQADLYLEGNDQHRGWFQSSLWLSVALTGQAPYKKIVTHGFVVDQNNEKMSKQKGNVVSPLEIVEQYGAEVLRFWVATTDYTKDVSCSKEIMKRSAEGYKKLRNTLRFLVANMPNKEPALTEIHPVDWWILEKSRNVFAEVHRSFGDCIYFSGMHHLMNYIISDLSGIYMNAAKDRLYCDNSDSHNSAILVMSKILRSLLGLLSPLFTYTTQEVFSYCPAWFRGNANDIFDLTYTTLPNLNTSERIEETYWEKALEEFHVAFDRIKTEGKVRDTLEVCLESHEKFFVGAEDWFVASKCGIVSDRSALIEFIVDNKKYRVVKSNEEKCKRCWKRIAEKDLCLRCQKIIDDLQSSERTT